MRAAGTRSASTGLYVGLSVLDVVVVGPVPVRQLAKREGGWGGGRGGGE